MSFLRRLFRRERREVVAFIDIGARRVVGAYVYYVGNSVPIVVYTKVVAIRVQTGEEHSVTMLGALTELCSAMETEGIPTVLRGVGRRGVDSTLISIDAPWQETAIHHVHVVKEKPFLFTAELVAEAVAGVSAPQPGRVFTDASVIGTVLNGYSMRAPYGKRVRRATTVVLTSSLDEKLSQDILDVVGKMTVAKQPALIAGTSLRYQALRVVFAHETEALILDATGPLPEVALVRNGLLAAVSETPESLGGETGVTSDDFMRAFAEIAKQYPLPRTIFLLARFDQMDDMQKKLSAVAFGAFWLSENPPRIIPLLTSNMTGLVKQMTTNPPDLPLLLMALYYRYLDKQ
ncbi:hypothetical protein COU19_01550 [Candidatus Kaiserbacteria bacterium CG10_big_fil_rev_8_21_14_0_10_56_12]|uniref:SHS2 domain-containing protein n=1 Tax=Candidatus Kaiserbacteria bacterium CG10_big_fil_rev_8_21_14_0_10_56_12 TaxID=1974611 RepID=A0A2H0UA24_9BACT|nr:MAG: hypothetical protein COU19_01550 [Candidatus Kaiserbacteria bacterium CG10_big_fil_rev_8_21_14_0_10_56_12]